MTKDKIRIDPSRTLIVLEGGSKDGQWFYEDDFTGRADNAEYQRTRRKAPHPSVRDVNGTVWAPTTSTDTQRQSTTQRKRDSR